MKDSPRKLKRKYEGILEKKEAEINELRKRLEFTKMNLSRKNWKIIFLNDFLNELKEKMVNLDIVQV